METKAKATVTTAERALISNKKSDESESAQEAVGTTSNKGPNAKTLGRKQLRTSRKEKERAETSGTEPTDVPESPQNLVRAVSVSIKQKPLVTNQCSALSRYPVEKTISSRSDVPADQVIRLVHKFNKANLVNKKEVNCKTIVDLFAGGSGILQQVRLQHRDCLTSDDFKKFEFISVDHPKISKAIMLDQRVDVYASQYALPEAQYICQPPITGGNDELEYSVHRIVSHRLSYGVLQYLVRWNAGGEPSGDAHKTYEPVEHLPGCETFVKAYETAEATRLQDEDEAARAANDALAIDTPAAPADSSVEEGTNGKLDGIICEICGADSEPMAWCNNTSNMRSHVSYCHKDIFVANETPSAESVAAAEATT
ncbi:hypothetical protein CYMTET_43792 [Cymbomonas tetramitiformis]|uniref:Chromo domain-containing protein n=1 Tax=Cymbomonas tetramitiformis TaxID=36881 RepID=A0AAE0C1G6_9CHLO|nr:hypothetical protein CYMTET_43792 [Cymbomonas tetramitiformis]